MIRTPLKFKLDRYSIPLLVSNSESYFGYLLSGIDIKIGDFEGFKWAASTPNTIKIQRSYVNEVEANSSKIKEFITLMLHEIYHIYLCHHWRFGFYKKALYREFVSKARYLQPLLNIIEDAIINHSLREAAYDFGELEQHGYFLDKLLEPNHPRIKSNDWNEEELLLYLLKNSEFGSSDGSGGEKDEEGEYIKFPSGTVARLGGVDLDVICDVTSESEEAQQDKLDELSKKAASLFSKDKSIGKLSAKLLPSIDINTSLIRDELNWDTRLKQMAINSINDRVITNNDVINVEPFYAYGMGMTSFNRCAIEHPYKTLPKPNTVAVFVDLSGSIFCCIDSLNKFLDQVSAIASTVGNLLLVTFDDGITGCYLFDMNEVMEPLGDLLIKNKEEYLVGGGGTDVIPLFKEFNDGFSTYTDELQVNTNNICMVVVLTDLGLQTVVPLDLQPTNSKGVVPTAWVVPQDDYIEDYTSVEFGEILVIK
jgi:predicted metal-dependent peptidase